MNIHPVVAAASPEVQMNWGFEALDWAAIFSKDPVTTAGLTWGYLGGRWNGAAIAAGTVALTDAATNHVVVHRGTGVVTVTTAATNWNDRLNYGRLYKLTTAGGLVTVTEDHRAGAGSVFDLRATHIDTTAVGNVGAGEDNLITKVLAVSILPAAGAGVRITAWGTTANNANAKTVKLYFGTIAILTTVLTVSQAGVWRITAEVFSTGVDAQDYSAQLLQGGTTTLVDVEGGSLTQDDGATITVKCTGTATADNDIVQEGMTVTLVN